MTQGKGRKRKKKKDMVADGGQNDTFTQSI